MAMAATMGTATFGSCRAETNVASPSGKLCTAMASAVSTPMRINFCGRGAPSRSLSTSRASWGFSSEGISLSITAMSSMPPKNAATVAQAPPRAPSPAVSDSCAVASISTMET